jgi:hypothetical protein
MSGNKVINRIIEGGFEVGLKYLKDIDGEKDINVSLGTGSEKEQEFYLRFYPLVYVFLKNITKEKLFKY